MSNLALRPILLISLTASTICSGIFSTKAYAVACQNLLLTPPSPETLNGILSGSPSLESRNDLENWLGVLKDFSEPKLVTEHLIDRFLDFEKRGVSLDRLRSQDLRTSHVTSRLAFDGKLTTEQMESLYDRELEADERNSSQSPLRAFRDLEKLLRGYALLQITARRPEFRFTADQMQSALDVLFEPESILAPFGVGYSQATGEISANPPDVKNPLVQKFAAALVYDILRARAPFLVGKNLDLFRYSVENERVARVMRRQLQQIYWRTHQRTQIEDFARAIGLELLLEEERPGKGGPGRIT